MRAAVSSTTSRGAKAGKSLVKPPKPKHSSRDLQPKDDYADLTVPETTVVIPDDQIKLTPKELDEDITRVVTANNPQLISNPVHFSFVEREYKPVPAAADEHTVFHFSQNGCVAHIDSDAASAQRAYEKQYRDGIEHKRRERQRALEESGDIAELSAQAAATASSGSGGMDDDDELLQRNQFNYTERAAQTWVPSTRDREVATIPVETHEASGGMSQWQLYDAYRAEVARSGAAASAERSAAGGGGAAGSSTVGSASAPSASTGTAGKPLAARIRAGGHGGSSAGGASGLMHSVELGEALRTLERMVVQNAEDEVHSDFAYWEDATDAFKPGTGTLLPLWRFDDGRGNPRRKSVTALAWNRLYGDMFAVGFGRYDFMKAGGSGGVAVYSLKNVATPEHVFPLDSGVMALAFHPQHPSILAAGCYDGSVRVFDARRRDARPVFASDVRTGTHSDPVWDVQWVHQAAPSDPLAFHSVSSDGRVACWTLSKAELRMDEVMRLKLVGEGAGGDGSSGEGGGGSPSGEDPLGASSGSSSSEAAARLHLTGGSGGSSLRSSSTLGAVTGGSGASTPGGLGASMGSTSSAATGGGGSVGLASGTCFDFNPFDRNTFLVGTEEGRIHVGNLEYTSQYVGTYSGHSMAVYAVRWNPYHPRVFLSASADWTVRLWDTSHPVAVMTFDLGTPVGDVAWAPYSSSTFAAVTDDGKTHVYDLAVSHHGPLCEQKVVKKAKATKLAFNRWSPMLLVGDSSGAVTSFKLSPNLRKLTPIPQPPVKKGEIPPPPPSREEVEIRKLDALLELTDARIRIVTPIPGQSRAKSAVGGDAEGSAEGSTASEKDGKDAV